MSFLSTLLALIYLSYNMANGGVLVLSDGTRWEINPQDQSKTSLWMTPMEIEVKPSDNQSYPYMLVNMQTKETVYAKVAQNEPMQNQPQDIVTDQGAQGTASAPQNGTASGTTTMPQDNMMQGQMPSGTTMSPQTPSGTAMAPQDHSMMPQTQTGTAQGTATPTQP
jgi:hypothetical protein